MRTKLRSTQPSLHIAFDFKEGPWGGGNQFLQSLRAELRARGRYAETIGDAQVVLINSFQIEQFRRLREVFVAKLIDKNVAVLHRLDGPFQLVRGPGAREDRHVFRINHFVADGTIFQSQWSMLNNIELGLEEPEHFIVALNATDKPAKVGEAGLRLDEVSPGRIKIVTTSWSSNANKGHQDLNWLAENLDPDRFSITLIGNTTLSNPRISRIPPLPRAELMDELRQYDIFLFPARNEPCSNALTEALAVGLPAIYFKGGANSEIVKGGGLPYERVEDIPSLLSEVVSRRHHFRNEIVLEDISEVASRYLRFAEDRYSSGTRKRPLLWLCTSGLLFYGSGLIQFARKINESINMFTSVTPRNR